MSTDKIKELGPQRIIELESENVKRLRAVHISVDDGLVVVGGKNKQGKSSTLDSIMYALAGGKAICAKPLRDGAKKGFAEIHTQDLIIKRTFTQKGGTLNVSLRDGGELKPAQGVLDAICGKLSFDPLAFLDMKKEEQAMTLRDLTGIDLSGLDAKRKKYYDERTDENRELKKIKAKLDALEITPGLGYDEVDAQDLLDKMKQAMEHNRQIEVLETELSNKRRDRDDALAKLKRLKEEVEEQEVHIRQIVEEGTQLREKREQLEIIDTSEISAKMDHIKEDNEKIRRNQEHQRLYKEQLEKADLSDKLTNQIHKIDEEKQRIVAEADMPIEGLSFDENGDVTFQGVPLEQVSQAEGLALSVSIGLASNPKLKIMLIRNGSLLDEDHMKLLGELADEHDAQVWIERVGKGDPGAIIIENGMVAE